MVDGIVATNSDMPEFYGYWPDMAAPAIEFYCQAIWEIELPPLVVSKVQELRYFELELLFGKIAKHNSISDYSSHAALIAETLETVVTRFD